MSRHTQIHSDVPRSIPINQVPKTSIRQEAGRQQAAQGGLGQSNPGVVSQLEAQRGLAYSSSGVQPQRYGGDLQGPVADAVNPRFAAKLVKVEAQMELLQIDRKPDLRGASAGELPATGEKMFVTFTEIGNEDRTRGMCRFCRKNSQGARCGVCQKVSYEKILFDKVQFLSSKWECANCQFRNVHSNNKCIECGSAVPRRR